MLAKGIALAKPKWGCSGQFVVFGYNTYIKKAD